MVLSIKMKYGIGGVLFGLLFPLISILSDAYVTYGSFSIYQLKTYYNQNFLHFIISTAPFVLGFTFYKIGVAIELLQREKKLYQNAHSHLKILNEDLELLNYHLSHDLKTSLNNTSSLALMLEKYIEPLDKKKVKSISEKLLYTANKGKVTINGFLKMAQVSLLDRKKLKSINIRQVVESVLEENNLGDQIKIEYHLDGFSEIYATEQALKSIFLNLITNTIKYSIKEPYAKISSFQSNKEKTLSFTDKGIGMDLEAEGHKIFEPFHKISKPENEDSSSVGLYIVKKLVTKLGWEVAVKSQVGEGSTFTFHLAE